MLPADEYTPLEAATLLWLELQALKPSADESFKTQIFVVESDAAQPHWKGLHSIEVEDDAVFVYDCSSGWADSKGSVTRVAFVPNDSWLAPEEEA
tara:strand:+ start:620 stop:904 length:285 start_codon:yes stop_codon:yes gene_type:complete